MMLLNLLRKARAYYSFWRNAKVGARLKLGPLAGCENLSSSRDNIVVGDDSYIMGTLRVCDEGRIEIGDHFYCGRKTTIGALQSVRIGRCVMISNDVVIYDNNNHPVSPKARMEMSLGGFSNENWHWRRSQAAPVVIEDNVWIGQYVTILKGVTIGRGSVVATRSVVVKDAPPYTIVAGNPAKVVKRLDPDED